MKVDIRFEKCSQVVYVGLLVTGKNLVADHTDGEKILKICAQRSAPKP
jgi:hypothetical protein